MIVTHFGINNQTFTNGGAAGSSGGGYGAGKKPGIFFHDAWNEYALVLPEKKKFSLTMGVALLHGIIKSHNGLNIKFLTIDAPIFNWPLIENSINLPDKWVYLPRKIR
jgi:hypothetical protein